MKSDYFISKKYACAFLNLYIDALSTAEIERLEILENFLRKNRFFYISLRIPTIKLEIKKIAIKKIVEHFQFKRPIEKLLLILLEAGRIELLHKVLLQIRYEYSKRTNIKFFKVRTSHPLTTKEKTVIVKLIQTLSNSNIRTIFKIDEELIVGIRIESPSFLWERSLRKELMKSSKVMAKEGIKC